MNIRKLLLTPEAARFYRDAEKKMYLLEARRAAKGCRLLKDAYQIEDIFVLLHCGAKDKKIVMWGGAVAQILLATAEGLVRFSGYNYSSDALSSWGSTEGGGDLHPGFDKVSYLADLSVSGRNAFETLEPPAGDVYLGGVDAYELALFATSNTVYGRQGSVVGEIATVPDTFLLQYAGAFGSLFGLPAYKTDSAWNLYRGLILYTLNAANQAVQDSWYWIPNFFTVQPADAYGLAPGWYYGHYPNSDYDLVVALESLKVSFKGVMQSIYTGGEYNYGWAEHVTEVNGVAVDDLNFYFQAAPLTVPGNATAYREAGISYAATITIGSDLSGAMKNVQLASLGAGTAVKFWSYAGFSAGSVGVLLTLGTHAKIYKYYGATQTVYETTTYHSYSLSQDGTILAVFESDEGTIIDRVVVYDLVGFRVPPSTVYETGGVTELRVSDTVASVEAITACLIPYRAEDFTPLTLGYDLAAATPTANEILDYTDYLPSLAILQFNKDGSGSPLIKKVTCTNGVDAEYGISVDDCFGSVVNIGDPDLGVDETKLVSWWDVGGIIKGVVRGSFVGGHPNMKFEGTGDASMGEITLGDDMLIRGNIDGTVSFENYTGDLSVGSCITQNEAGDYIPDESCIDPCATGLSSYTMTASSSCGQEASKEVEYDAGEPEELWIEGTETPIIGSAYTAGGGVGTLTFSVSCGEIGASGQINSITGCCGQGTVTVTDSCGGSAEIKVRFPGKWETISTTHAECWSNKPGYDDGYCYGHYDTPTNKIFFCAGPEVLEPLYCEHISEWNRSYTTYGERSPDGYYFGYSYWWIGAGGALATDCGCGPNSGSNLTIASDNVYQEWVCDE